MDEATEKQLELKLVWVISCEIDELCAGDLGLGELWND